MCDAWRAAVLSDDGRDGEADGDPDQADDGAGGGGAAGPAALLQPLGRVQVLQMRKGGLVRVYDSVLVAELEYKAEPHLTHRNDSETCLSEF